MRPLIISAIFFYLFMSCTSDDVEMREDDMMEQQMKAEGYSGSFVTVAHTTNGTATINEDKTILTLSNFKTDPGPVLELYVATTNDATDFISLGELKGIDGNYEYTLPNNLNYETYKYVIVWCVEFSVNFGYAELSEI